MKRILFLIFTLLFFSACSTRSVTINGLICPEGHSTHQVQKDLTQCRYYDEKKAAEASKSPIEPACKACLEDRGYKLEE
jgi:hypothetical protein